MTPENTPLADRPVVALVDGIGGTPRRGLSVSDLAVRLRGLMMAEGFAVVPEDVPSWLRVAWGVGTPAGGVAQTGDRDRARHLLEALDARIALASAWGEVGPVLSLLSTAQSWLLHVLRVHVVPVPSPLAGDLFGLRRWLFGQAILSVARQVRDEARPLAGQRRWVAEGAVRLVIAAAEPAASLWRPTSLAPLVEAADGILGSPAWAEVVAGEATREALAVELADAVRTLPRSERVALVSDPRLPAAASPSAAQGGGRRGAVVDLLPLRTPGEPIRWNQTSDGVIWAVADAPSIAAFMAAALHGAIRPEGTDGP